jgi:hypothetical protein
MNEQPKDVKDLQGEELIQWLKSRAPLFTDSVEFEGMSLCFVNPELVEEEAPKQEQTQPAENTPASV